MFSEVVAPYFSGYRWSHGLTRTRAVGFSFSAYAQGLTTVASRHNVREQSFLESSFEYSCIPT